MLTKASDIDGRTPLIRQTGSLQVPDAVEAAIREADVLDQDGNISLAEFEGLIQSADTDVLDLFDTRHHS